MCELSVVFPQGTLISPCADQPFSSKRCKPAESRINQRIQGLIVTAGSWGSTTAAGGSHATAPLPAKPRALPKAEHSAGSILGSVHPCWACGHPLPGSDLTEPAPARGLGEPHAWLRVGSEGWSRMLLQHPAHLCPGCRARRGSAWAGSLCSPQVVSASLLSTRPSSIMPAQAA